MPSEPEQQTEESPENPKVNARELSQTDHLNKKLLISLLEKINANELPVKFTNGVDQPEENDEEWEN